MASVKATQNIAPNKDSWYRETRMRVRGAELSYRKDANAEWTRLEDSYQIPPWRVDEPGLKLEKVVLWNVENMCITGSGIAIEQHDHLYKPGPTGKKGVRQVLESEHTWRVTFRQGEFKDVWLSERKKPSEKDLFIELRFTCSEAPESVDATELANTATEQADTIVEEGEVDVEGKEKPSTPAEEDEDADEDEDEEMDDSEPNASDHPLAKLFEDPESIPGLEIRLVFRRGTAVTKSKPLRWIWPAVIYFLAGREEWIPNTKAWESGKKYGMDSWQLDDQLTKKPDQAAAVFERKVLEGDPERAMEWKLRARPQLPRPSAPQQPHDTAAASAVTSSLRLRTEAPSKRKRNEEEDCDGEIEAAEQAKIAAELALQETGRALRIARAKDDEAREIWERATSTVQNLKENREAKRRR